MAVRRNYLITAVIMVLLLEIIVIPIIISNILIKCIHKLINNSFSNISIDEGLEDQKLEQVSLKRALKWLLETQY